MSGSKAPLATGDAGTAPSCRAAFEAMGPVRRLARAAEFWALLALMVGPVTYFLLQLILR